MSGEASFFDASCQNYRSNGEITLAALPVEKISGGESTPWRTLVLVMSVPLDRNCPF
jgi:hypothetical protein